jgi:hypothetical protein
MSEPENKEPLYGFWTYDLFPYTLSGIIDETKPLVDHHPSARYVPSYGRNFNMLATIRGERGAKLKQNLEALRENHKREQDALHARMMDNLCNMMRTAGVSHPATIAYAQRRANK